MNKQEKEELIEWISKFSVTTHTAFGRIVSINTDVLVNKIQQIDEPKKVKVKQYVADWFEEHKDFLELSLGRITPDIRTKIVQGQALSEFEKWFNKTRNKPFETIIRMKDGYEVEEEPKWKIINDQKYCLTSIEAGYGNSLHWAFDSTKKKPILFDNKETALYTAYITGGTVEKV